MNADYANADGLALMADLWMILVIIIVVGTAGLLLWWLYELFLAFCCPPENLRARRRSKRVIYGSQMAQLYPVYYRVKRIGERGYTWTTAKECATSFHRWNVWARIAAKNEASHLGRKVWREQAR